MKRDTALEQAQVVPGVQILINGKGFESAIKLLVYISALQLL